MMPCEKCEGDTKIVDKVINYKYKTVYRKMKCLACGHVFYTVELKTTFDKNFKEQWEANREKTLKNLIYQKGGPQ